MIIAWGSAASPSGFKTRLFRREASYENRPQHCKESRLGSRKHRSKGVKGSGSWPFTKER